ncbi:juvenile hormone acid O-methyltransferase-like [Centruroides vittatus]|uniref:juvenile hormone acid O-methyltransferase-like n=1 Tax=Centruroides vittatus TaxID=120091 RepID=UPI00350F6722
MEGTAEDFDRVPRNTAHLYLRSCLDFHFSTIEWSDDDIILDIGCGPGRITKEILLPKCPKLKKLVAIDVDPSSIEYARKTYFAEKIEYKTQDILKGMDLEENRKYDKIVSFFTFQLIPDFEKLFSVISSILKPGGFFFFTIVTKAHMFTFMRELTAIKEWSKYIKTEEVLSLIPPTSNWEDVETEFKKFLTKFELRVKSSKCDVITLSFVDKKQFLDFFLYVFPKAMFKNMEPDVKCRLWKMAEPIALRSFFQSKNGEGVHSYEVLQVSGYKEM